MKKFMPTFFIMLLSLVMINCSTNKKEIINSKIVYKSNDLIITQISKHAFQHTSFLNTESFGKVPCNGLIVYSENEAVVFDSTTDDKSSEELISWIKNNLNSKITAIVPTHFHEDCLGGLKAFHTNNIPSYSYFKTIEFAKNNNSEVPKNNFNNSLVLKLGNKECIVSFFGEGHTKDNVVAYFPDEDIMFGGCLIKELNANKGFLGDSNVTAWSNTVEKVKKQYPNVKIIIPGHGNLGDKKLLDYTISLFNENENL